MIGSFWNLCRACPSMPVDKLHSEYRSTYKWHEYTGPRQEVVRRAPQAVPAAAGGSGLQTTGGSNPPKHASKPNEEDSATTSAVTFEPAIPRRKKHPELAYRTNEFLGMSEVGGSDDSIDTGVTVERARVMTSYPTTAPPAGPISNAITRINTEYRLQFAWPKGDQGRPPRGEDVQDGGASGPPRKSLSMGALRPSGTLVPVHKKPVLDIDRGDEGGSELEPLVRPDLENGPLGIEIGELYGEEKIQDEMSSKGEKSRRRKEFKTEYKKKFRPFSQYDYVEGKFQKKKESESVSLPFAFAELPQGDSWYREVLELRRKAGEYKGERASLFKEILYNWGFSLLIMDILA
uniref:Nuclear protein MDM1 n=2 Tax=Timema TaxID=61471 RepID=A0A7R8VE64_TIMDO|nr:unnamed protein product [Timema douglasi]